MTSTIPDTQEYDIIQSSSDDNEKADVDVEGGLSDTNAAPGLDKEKDKAKDNGKDNDCKVRKYILVTALHFTSTYCLQCLAYCLQYRTI